MSDLKTYTLPLDQFSQAGRDLLAFAQNHPALFGILTVAIVAGLVTIIVFLALGFTPVGVAAGGLSTNPAVSADANIIQPW